MFTMQKVFSVICCCYDDDVILYVHTWEVGGKYIFTAHIYRGGHVQKLIFVIFYLDLYMTFCLHCALITAYKQFD